MRNTRTWVMLGVAVVAGLLAVYLASRWLTQQSARNLSGVVVAATDISLGQRLTPELLKRVDWPSSSTPEGAFTDISVLEGRVLRNSLLKGEPVLEAKLAPLGTKGGLSAVIGEGRRAITVRVNDVIGVAGFALPGNYVDIIVNTQRDADARQRDKVISKIVLERILVLAVAQEVSRDETRPKVVNAVTLEVTPEQAEKLDLARSVGTLSLVLRNQVDPQPVDTAGATKTTLLADAQDAAAAQAGAGAAPTLMKTAARAKTPMRAGMRAAPRTASGTDTRPVAPTAGSAEPVAGSGHCSGVINGLRSAQECY